VQDAGARVASLSARSIGTLHSSIFVLHINSSCMSKLDNYLRTYRRRAGISQDEMAFLLGTHDGTKVSRYERLARTPGLETALAYEAIFGISVRELFAGVYQRVERAARRRAQLLRKRVGRVTSERIGKLKILGEAAPDDGQPKLAA